MSQAIIFPSSAVEPVLHLVDAALDLGSPLLVAVLVLRPSGRVNAGFYHWLFFWLGLDLIKFHLQSLDTVLDVAFACWLLWGLAGVLALFISQLSLSWGPLALAGFEGSQHHHDELLVVAPACEILSWVEIRVVGLVLLELDDADVEALGLG